ncbi:MAG TPA: response regulator [Myxococcales bacterium]|nr:response regulator [Myxococcales bacterium]
MTEPRSLVLVVEDEPDTRKLVRKYLEKLGFDVLEAASGKAALAVLEEHLPALVCLDLMLPEISGYDVCERIRATPRLQGMPVLVISARSQPPDRALAEEVGATAYLIKPIRWNTFSETVLRLLGKDAPAGSGAG